MIGSVNVVTSEVPRVCPRRMLEEYLKLAQEVSFPEVFSAWASHQVHFVSFFLRTIGLWAGGQGEELSLQAAAWRLRQEGEPSWGDVALYGVPPGHRRIGFCIGDGMVLTTALSGEGCHIPIRHALDPELFEGVSLTGVWTHNHLRPR